MTQASVELENVDFTDEDSIDVQFVQNIVKETAAKKIVDSRTHLNDLYARFHNFDQMLQTEQKRETVANVVDDTDRVVSANKASMKTFVKVIKSAVVVVFFKNQIIVDFFSVVAASSFSSQARFAKKKEKRKKKEEIIEIDIDFDNERFKKKRKNAEKRNVDDALIEIEIKRVSFAMKKSKFEMKKRRMQYKKKIRLQKQQHEERMFQIQIQLIIIQTKDREFQISKSIFEAFVKKSFVKMKQ